MAHLTTADWLARIERASGTINDERFRTWVMAQAVPYSSPVTSDATAECTL
jgi:hypothetical protein